MRTLSVSLRGPPTSAHRSGHVRTLDGPSSKKDFVFDEIDFSFDHIGPYGDLMCRHITNDIVDVVTRIVPLHPFGDGHHIVFGHSRTGDVFVLRPEPYELKLVVIRAMHASRNVSFVGGGSRILFSK